MFSNKKDSIFISEENFKPRTIIFIFSLSSISVSNSHVSNNKSYIDFGLSTIHYLTLLF
jgi:hypothetical protein